MYEVIFYETIKGKCPIEEFLNNLEPKMRAKVLRNLDLLNEYGPALREPYSKFLGDGLFEVRTQFDGNITRVLYFFISGKSIILTNGFTKSTRKTPPSEIEFAKKYRDDFIKRKVLK